MPALRSRTVVGRASSSNILPSYPLSPLMPRGNRGFNHTPPAPFSFVSATDLAEVSEALALVTSTQLEFHGVGALPEGDVVFHTQELRGLILEFCDHFTVVSFSRANREARVAAQTEIRRRIHLLVSPFVPTVSFDSFMDMLSRTGSVVVGSIVRQLFMMNSVYLEDLSDPDFHTFTACSDLNVVAPAGQGSACMTWFSGLNYGSWTLESARNPASGYQGVASSFASATRVMRNGQTAIVSITESRNAVVPVVVASTHTAQANAISATNLYCFYPNLATSPGSLKSDMARAHLPRPSTIPFTVEYNNRSWKTPCGALCPAKYRKTTTDRAIAMFHWNDAPLQQVSRRVNTDALLSERALKWRFSRACRNRNCSNYTPDARRARLR